MANPSEVIDVLTTLNDANLSFPPRDITATAKVWTNLLKDIPGDTLKQAAMDYILTEKEFPKLADIRHSAADVMTHNGKSAASNPFRDDSNIRRAPGFVREECDRLTRKIGYLLGKDMADWTAADGEAYENAIGAKRGSQAEADYWEWLYGSAYFIPQAEPPAHPEFHSWEEAQAWQEEQRMLLECGAVAR
jgi:hypothetical protein